FEQVCLALAFAHTRRVIHRDLKPHNVMVGAFGEVQVMDWGLAKVLQAGEQTSPQLPGEGQADTVTAVVNGGGADGPGLATQHGWGTPAYMAPEQARGEYDLLDERADVFGLGAVLCDVLTGQPPFAAGTPERSRWKAMRGDLAECLTRLDGCGADPELIELAKGCLAAEPEGRPRDAGAVAAAVAAYRAGVQDRLRQTELERAEAGVRAEAAKAAAKATATAKRKARKVRRRTVSLVTKRAKRKARRRTVILV